MVDLGVVDLRDHRCFWVGLLRGGSGSPRSKDWQHIERHWTGDFAPSDQASAVQLLDHRPHLEAKLAPEPERQGGRNALSAPRAAATSIWRGALARSPMRSADVGASSGGERIDPRDRDRIPRRNAVPYRAMVRERLRGAKVRSSRSRPPL